MADKEVGSVVYFDPPSQHPWAGLSIMVLSGLMVVFVGLFLQGLLVDLGTGRTAAIVSEQRWLALWLGMAFLDLGFILLLYRKFFMPDKLIVKRRRRKYEDL